MSFLCNFVDNETCTQTNSPVKKVHQNVGAKSGNQFLLWYEKYQRTLSAW
jgi:hypothetical protein